MIELGHEGGASAARMLDWQQTNKLSELLHDPFWSGCSTFIAVSPSRFGSMQANPASIYATSLKDILNSQYKTNLSTNMRNPSRVSEDLAHYMFFPPYSK